MPDSLYRFSMLANYLSVDRFHTLDSMLIPLFRLHFFLRDLVSLPLVIYVIGYVTRCAELLIHRLMIFIYLMHSR
jgi:hypothetical protein